MSLALASVPALAGPPGGLAERRVGRSVRVAEVGAAPDTFTPMVRVSFEPAVATALVSTLPGERVRLDAFPVAPEERRDVVLERVEIYAPYAPDSRIVVAGPTGEVEAPRSARLYFRGSIAGESALSLALSVDPPTGDVAGFIRTGSDWTELRPPRGPGEPHELAPSKAFLPFGSPPLQWTCGGDSLAEPPSEPAPPQGAKPPPGVESALGSALPVSPLAATKTAVIAIDTDNELLNLKFGNDTTAATNYLASLFNAMNLIYERDAGVRLLQGYTVLRPSTTTDPWTIHLPGNAGGAKLNEFSTYWSTNYGGVRRALAAMISGRQGNPNQASGVAWAGSTTLCSRSYGYSFDQVFMTSYLEGDTLIVAHEVGHNFSSPHTHCYTDPKPDTCYSGESGCFSGTPSCPATATYNGVSARGTLMSYCHLLSGCSAALVFHDLSLTRYLNGAIATATGSCIFAMPSPPSPAAAPTISSVSPGSGPISGGTTVTVTGTNFRSGAVAYIADLAASGAMTAVQVVNATTVTGIVPAHAAGAVDVVVQNVDDMQTATARGAFTFSSTVQPTLTSVAPNFGSTAGGTSVTVTGASFVSGATVTFGGTAASSVTFGSSTSLTATTAARAAGTVDVVVTNPGPASATLPISFTYLVPPTPPPSPTSRSFYALSPCRVADTRADAGAFGAPILPASSLRLFPVTLSSCGIPSDAAAVSLNVTVTNPAEAGYFTLFAASSASAPLASTINFRPGQTRANSAIVPLGWDGSGALKVLNGSPGAADLLIDVNGYFR